MRFRVEGATGLLTVSREWLWRLGLFVFFALRILSQPTIPAPSSGNTGDAAITPKVEPPMAAIAMEQSILRQKQAIQAAQQAQKGSLALQRASLRLQRRDATADVARTPLSTTDTTLGSFSDEFFSTRWAPVPPAVMPNIRIPTVACPALADAEVDKLIKLAADKNAIAPGLIRAVMRQESAFRPCAVSTAGAMGLMQIMPGTAETLGLEDAFSPGDNVEAGARYLKQLLDRYHGDRRLALGAYNAGPSRVDNAGGIPDIPETIDYVSRILNELPDETATTPAAETTQAPATPTVGPAAQPDAASSPGTALAPLPAP